MSHWRANPWVRLAGYALGLGLLALAVVVAVRQVDFAVIASADPWLLAAMVATVAVNLLLTGLLFHLVTRGFDAMPPVPLARMLVLIAGSSLLNFLPLRPGLLGRAAYLKLHHGLPVRQSVLILAVVLAVGAAVTIGAGLIVLLLDDAAVRWALAVAAMLLASAVAPIIARRLLRGRRLPGAWAYVTIRAADLLVASGRLMLAFQVLGAKLPLDVAVLAAAAGMLLAMAGITPNGLGMKEWAIAGLAAAQTTLGGPLGLAAAVLDRAAEAIACILLGGPSVAVLTHAKRSTTATQAPTPTPPHA